MALGTVATTIAVIAVAAIGLLMLSGRLELRRGITVMIGGFILFGAGSIAVALTGIAESGAKQGKLINVVSGPLESQLRSPAQTPTAYDPYAGASVPKSQ